MKNVFFFSFNLKYLIFKLKKIKALSIMQLKFGPNPGNFSKYFVKQYRNVNIHKSLML